MLLKIGQLDPIQFYPRDLVGSLNAAARFDTDPWQQHQMAVMRGRPRSTHLEIRLQLAQSNSHLEIIMWRPL